MSDILLTAYPGSILGPIAKLLGILMDWIYSGISNITGGRVESVVLSIVIITIIIYMCLLPLTIKQQKFSKLSQKMQPEMQAIQAKYKNKKGSGFNDGHAGGDTAFIPEVRYFSDGKLCADAYTDAYSVCTVPCVLQYSCLSERS